MALEATKIPDDAAMRSRSQTPVSVFAYVTVLMLVVACAGCQVVGPDYDGAAVPPMASDYAASIQSTSSLPPQADPVAFWSSFSDPILDQLVAQALANNLSVQQAAERILESRSRVSLVGGQLLPTGNLEQGYSFSKQSSNAYPFVGQNGTPFSLFRPGLDSVWEIDLFGRLERSIESAAAELRGDRANLLDVQQTLTADVATTYFDIRLLQEQIAVYQESQKLLGQTLSMIQEGIEVANPSELDEAQLSALTFRVRSQQVELEKELKLRFTQLAILLGETPSVSLPDRIGQRPLPAETLAPIAGIPADLLRCRPDLRVVEAKVNAATAEVGVATADLYPRLTLIGNISLQARDYSRLFQSESLAFAIGPSLRWNILHFGRICDNIDIQESRLKQAVLAFQEAVLTAVREVEDCMIQWEAFSEQQEVLGQALAADTEAVELSLSEYQDGKADFQRVLNAQEKMLEDSQNLIAARAGQIIQLIRLFRATGGGWPGPSGTHRVHANPGQVQPGNDAPPRPSSPDGFRILEIDEPPANRPDGSTPWDQGALPSFDSKFSRSASQPNRTGNARQFDSPIRRARYALDAPQDSDANLSLALSFFESKEDGTPDDQPNGTSTHRTVVWESELPSDVPKTKAEPARPIRPGSIWNVDHLKPEG